MNIVLSYIGPLPEYTIDCIKQIRLFNTTSPIYLILDDIESQYIIQLQPYNVILIPYETVKHEDFLNLFETNKKQFSILEDLGDRKFIFMRSIERFFLLFNLMQQRSLTDVLFMEIDNTIYDDPSVWLEEFSQNDLCFMFDNEYRFSSGIFYTKSANSLIPLLICVFKNAHKHTCWYSDMTILYELWETDFSNNILLLPTHTGFVSSEHEFFNNGVSQKNSLNVLTHMNYEKFGNSTFDAAGMGVYLFGCDPYHSKGVIIHNNSEKTWSHIKYSQYEYKWERDSKNRNIPYINFGDGNWIRINNLHIHSKDLKSALSI